VQGSAGQSGVSWNGAEGHRLESLLGLRGGICGLSDILLVCFFLVFGSDQPLIAGKNRTTDRPQIKSRIKTADGVRAGALFGQHGTHHVSGVFGMIGDGSDDFGQADQMKDRNRIDGHVEQTAFHSMLEFVGIMLLPTQ
jgi:hypothetical protein